MSIYITTDETILLLNKNGYKQDAANIATLENLKPFLNINNSVDNNNNSLKDFIKLSENKSLYYSCLKSRNKSYLLDTNQYLVFSIMFGWVLHDFKNFC